MFNENYSSNLFFFFCISVLNIISRVHATLSGTVCQSVYPSVRNALLSSPKGDLTTVIAASQCTRLMDEWMNEWINEWKYGPGSCDWMVPYNNNNNNNNRCSRVYGLVYLMSWEACSNATSGEWTIFYLSIHLLLDQSDHCEQKPVRKGTDEIDYEQNRWWHFCDAILSYSPAYNWRPCSCE